MRGNISTFHFPNEPFVQTGREEGEVLITPSKTPSRLDAAACSHRSRSPSRHIWQASKAAIAIWETTSVGWRRPKTIVV